MKNIIKYFKKRISRLSSAFLFISCLLIFICLNAESPAAADSERYDELKSYIKQKMKAARTPSITIGAARDGEIIWEKSFGWADREKQITASPGTIYSLASISKPMTATAIMILAERGLIDLNKPVNTYLGNSKLTAYEGNAEDATVARLLHHTAGLPTIWSFYFDGAKFKRPPVSVSIEKYGIICSPPGTVYEYSNLGYGTAECIIEQVSGKSYAEFMKTEVFEPLGMYNTFVPLDKSQYDSIAVRYLENKSGSPFYQIMSRGGGGICSSLRDLLRFGMFHLKNRLPGQKAVLSHKTIDFMQNAVDPKVPDSPYKIGWSARTMHGYQTLTHGGGMPGVSSALILIPSKNTVIAVLSNGTYLDLFKIAGGLLVHTLPEKETADKPETKKSKTVSYPEFPSETFTGRWHGEILTDEAGIPVQLDIDDEGSAALTLTDTGEKCLPLQPFQYRYGTLSASFDFNIPSKETSVCRHKVNLSLKLRGSRLSGYAAAESYRVEVYYLPYYIRLDRRN